MTMTIHQLHHLAKCVLRYGPLWTTWLFSFESYNGFCTSFIHTQQMVEMQVMDAFKMNHALLAIEDQLPAIGTLLKSKHILYINSHQICVVV